MLRPPAQDDGYPDVEPLAVPLATGIRAHFSRPRGLETGDAAQRSFVTAHLACDPTDLTHLDLIRDERSGEYWRVEWVERRAYGSPLDHVAAGVREEVVEVEAGQP